MEYAGDGVVRVTTVFVRVAEAAHARLRRAGLGRLTPAALLGKGLSGLRRQLKLSVDPAVAFGWRTRGGRVIEVRHPYGHPVDRPFRGLRDLASSSPADDRTSTLRRSSQ
jgi:hypothetical protein